jgi:hypothetical protein
MSEVGLMATNARKSTGYNGGNLGNGVSWPRED